MATNDFVDLVMSLARQQMNTLEYRDDELIHILKIVNEHITITDSVMVTFNPHPVKYDGAAAIYDRCTYA